MDLPGGDTVRGGLRGGGLSGDSPQALVEDRREGAYIQLKGMESFTGMYIEYEDEDPRIRSDYIAAIRAEGVSFQMPDVSYHKD